MTPELPSIVYEPDGAPSLFQRWEVDHDGPIRAPLSVCEPAYRAFVVERLARWLRPGDRLISVGAGNGFTEAALASGGWNVLATDPAPTALECCRAKGLTAARFDVMEDPMPGRFEAIYADGVLGHLWRAGTRCREAWERLALLGVAGAVCLVSNDLAEGDAAACFDVRGDDDARYYRPPRGWTREDAEATGRWEVVDEAVYIYHRRGIDRRREVTVAQLLLDEGIEPQGRA